MTTYLLLYFVAGVVLSVITTKGIHFISAGNPLMSALFSSGNTLINLTVVVSILRDINQYGLSGVFSYAVGVGVGAYVSLLKPSTKLFKEQV